MTDSLGSFSDMLRDALGSRLDPGAASFVEMFADDGVMEFPFAFPGETQRVEGREQLNDYLLHVGKLIAFDRIGKATVHETKDSQTVVLEFEGFGRGTSTNAPYQQRYISVIRTLDGRIVHYRDYWNPLALLSATRGPEAVAALASQGKSHG